MRGAADQVLVWDENGAAVAYMTGKLLPDGIGSVELVGVHPDWQGKGIGYQLTMQILAWFQLQGVYVSPSVTQGRNIRGAGCCTSAAVSLHCRPSCGITKMVFLSLVALRK